MDLAGELAKYIGNEMIKTGGKELAKAGAKSALSNLVPSMVTKVGTGLATKTGTATLGSLVPKVATSSTLGGRMLDKTGKPISFYHSTPNEFTEFDDKMLGSNTGYDNTKLGHFVTSDKDFSERFIDIDNVGKTGKTMELQAKISNPVTHPYLAGGKYPEEQLDDILKNWIKAISKDEKTANEIIQDYVNAAEETKGLMLENGEEYNTKSPLWDEYMNQTFSDEMNPFEYATDDKKALMKNGYDAVEIVEGLKNELVDGSKDTTPVSSYAVFEGKNLRPVSHIPVDENYSPSSPVPVKRKLYRGQQYSDTDFSYNSELMNEDPDKWGSSDVGKGYHFTPKKDMAGSWEGSDGGVIEVDYTPDQILKADDAKKMIEEAGNLLSDSEYMAKLWQEDEALAEQIEKIADGNLEALAKREGKPFVQHLKANDDELGTVYYYKDVDPELTDRFVSEFRQKAEKYMPKKLFGDKNLSDNFSDSKIRDKRGNLLKLYHGTNADFSEFGDVKTEPGYWFTEDKSYASSHGKNLKTVNLNMVKPLDMTTVDGDNKMLEYAKDCFGEGNFSEDDILSNKFRDYLVKLGYDGMIFDHSGKNTYIAFSPKQIKILDK